MAPDTKYARSGDVSIAYQVFGDGPLDLVVVPGFISHVDLFWESPRNVHIAERLAKFARVIFFDKRGTGLSDPVLEPPPFEVRMDDIRAILDEVGVERASLFGGSEGVPLSILFAATYPKRTHSLVLYGGMAKTMADEDYPWGTSPGAFEPEGEELLAQLWGQGATIELFAPSMQDNEMARSHYAKLERQGASPSMVLALNKMYASVDVRHVLPAITAPTLILHRVADRVVNIRNARYLADNIKGAKLVEQPGIDHSYAVGDTDSLLDEIEEFLTGVRPVTEPDRILATVLLTDIVSSTAKATEIGDEQWHRLLEDHNRIARESLKRHGGREVKTTGDGFLVTFDGPARAISCAVSIAQEVRKLGIEIRAGIHTGECEVMGEDIGGVGVHIAARVADRAGPNEILVSRTVKDLVVGSGLEFAERGTYVLKGIPDEWALFAVTPHN